MARFFGGLGGKGSGGDRFGGTRNPNGTGSVSGSQSSLERAMASKDFMKNAKSNKGTQSNEARYQELVQKKMENAKKQLMADKKFNTGNMLPGTKPVEKEMSKSTQIAMELIAQKMAKKEMKGLESKQPLTIKPMHITGMYPGFIDAKGRVYNRTGQIIMKINMENGAVMTMGLFGKKLCKFDPKSSSCFFKMSKELEKDYYKRNKDSGAGFNIHSSGGHGDTTGGVSIYGTTSTDDNNGGGGLGW